MATMLITGANRGIGLELARQYAQSGDTVLACCRNPAGASALTTLAGSVRVHELAVDVEESVTALATSLAGLPIDVLINNAGISGPPRAQQSVWSTDFEGSLSTFAVNTLGPVRVMQALAENLRAAAGAKVINISSQLGAISLDMHAGYAYCSSKAALNKWTRLAAIELAREGILTCVIHPGWVRTDMGGARADISPEESATGIRAVIAQLSLQNTGSFWNWNGEPHEW